MANIQSVRKFHIDTPYFTPRATLTCGQVFRYEKVGENWFVQSGGEIAYLVPSIEGGFDIFCSDEQYFKNYFDLKRDYGYISLSLCVNPLLEKAVEFGKGIRILRQEPIETIISFIISANNNIPRIKLIIGHLCEVLGEKREFCGKIYYTFPTIKQLASQEPSFYERLGAGYRSSFITDTARVLAHGDVSIAELKEMSTAKAKTKLLSLKGVGNKVADCILLYAFDKTDVFPVDTWMEKVYKESFSNIPRSKTEIARYFVNSYGGMAGFCQQYLFYYRRNCIDANHTI